MSLNVNLLLLLSAILSALTGAGAGMRPAQAAVAVSRVVEASVSVGQAVPSHATRPAIAMPTRVDVATIDGAAWAIAPAVPLYLSRRRE